MANAPDHAVQKIFVILDPTRLVQPVVEKAEWVAARNGAAMHLYCCIWDADGARDEAAAKRTIDRTRAWIERIAESSRGHGIAVSTEVEWAPDWREAIVAASRAAAADLVVKTASKHSSVRRQLTKTSDWELLRNASCPTLLVDPGVNTNTGTVLAAVKLKPGSETHTVLNRQVVELAHRIAGVLEADLHAVTVYKGDDIFFDRQAFADSCQLPRNRVHAVEGSPVGGIAEVVKKINAGVLIIGCAAKQAPERGIIIGDTAQRVIDEERADMIVVPAA